ncbi:hypothetical protein [Coraliomargarita sinensis]|nr:hypothetical protein [Coraliomargarita sinensis]
MEATDFEPVFRHVMNVEELHSHAKETSVSPTGYQRKLVGTRFIWSPPDTAQALIHALPESQRRDLLDGLQEAYDLTLERSFGTQPRTMAIHTDKVRLHIEAIVLKFQKDKIVHPGFKGTSRGHTDDTSRAVSAAQFGCSWQFKYFHSRMAYEMTRCVMEKIRHLYTTQYAKEPDACIHRLAVANEYLDFLTIAATDETLSARNSLRKSADFKRPDFPFRYYLDQHIPDPQPVHNPPNFILRARIRIHRILLRRAREKNWLHQKLSRQARMILYSFARRPHISARFKDPDGDAMVKAAAKEIEQAKLMSGIERGILLHYTSSVKEIEEEVKSSAEKIPILAEKGTSVADEDPQPAKEETKPVTKTANKTGTEQAKGDSARQLPPIESHDLPEGIKDSAVPSSPADRISPPGQSEEPETSQLPPQPGFFNDLTDVEVPQIPEDPLFDEWMKHYKPTPMEQAMMRQEGGFEDYLSIRVKEFEERKTEIAAKLVKSKRSKSKDEPEI